MDHLLVSIGDIGADTDDRAGRPTSRGWPGPVELAAAATLRLDAPVRPRRVAATPAGVDEVVRGLGPSFAGRLIIDADLAGLQLVLGRLQRAGVLATTATAVLAREPVPYLSALGLADDLDGQLSALGSPPRLIGVIKDDSGGVCVDHAELGPWPGSSAPWWVRAVVDDQRLCDGPARSVTVRRLGPAELEATVVLGRIRKRVLRGRSLQLACDPALVRQDGVARERPRSKRTLWSEPELWRCAL
ncbi:hypothetical protein M6D93_18765 [Jatrophihabitans telluris]|uniref:Uncharacterized protein n=1 Tax=Jatrophihabitans telluris TaxID=2038343 RepID=A0ABY4QYW3_9ACTN|nr:hypothetical protein [Jatrophihabitans telluris]UQX88302.1 hypothetical protein M6D93_18765 [Jatrophihabitans telluris]